MRLCNSGDSAPTGAAVRIDRLAVAPMSNRVPGSFECRPAPTI
jgi:hypothetical protein